MAYNIRDIVNSVGTKGVLSVNKYLVFFTSPKNMRGLTISGIGGSSTTQTTEALLQIRAESAKLPGVLIQTTDINRVGIGPTQKMPFNAQFTDTSITFISDGKGEIYNYFYTWLNSIFDFSGIYNRNAFPSYKTEYKDNYTTDLQINVYDNYGNKIQTVTMFKAYPVSFNEVSLGWNQQNELMKFTVGFTFRDWKLESIDQTIPQSQVSAPPLSPQASTTNPPSKQTSPVLEPLGQNEFNPLKGQFNGINGTGATTPTFLPGS